MKTIAIPTDLLKKAFPFEQDILTAPSWDMALKVVLNGLERVLPDTARVLYFNSDARFVMASSQNEIDRQTAFAAWAEDVVKKADTDDLPVTYVNDAYAKEEDTQALKKWCGAHVYLLHIQGAGALWVETEKELAEDACHYAERLAYLLRDCCAHHHTQTSFLTRVTSRLRPTHNAYLLPLLLVLFVMCMFIPVDMSVNARAIISPKNPRLVTAPVSGVIKDVLVDPYKAVQQDQQLIVFDPREWESEERILREDLAVATAKWRTTLREAFLNSESKRHIETLAAEMSQKQADLDALLNRMDRANVKSPMNGVAIFDDKASLMGRAVNMGEKLMMVAAPNEKELTVFMDTNDMIRVDTGKDVSFKPESGFLSSFDAQLDYVSYEPSMDEDGALSYKIKAHFIQPEQVDVPIGTQGQVRLYGESTILFFHLFRKPLAFIKQGMGM